MHTLYFVMDPETLPLARDIYKLSQHPTQVSQGHERANGCMTACVLFIGHVVDVNVNSGQHRGTETSPTPGVLLCS